MNTVALQPTKPIIGAADLIYEGISRYLQCMASLPQHCRGVAPRYEANAEAWVLFRQIIRHVEAITELAKNDLVLLPPALALARVAFEITTRILWMLHPDEVFDREARFLAHLASEEEYWGRSAALLEEFGYDGKHWQEQRDRVRRFRTAVEELLPPGTNRVTAIPNFRAMLKEIGDELRYGHYIRLSQFSHGSHAAGGIYRKGLGGGKMVKEFVYPESWAEPLSCAWWCIAMGGCAILRRLGDDPARFLSKELFDKVEEALNKVRNAKTQANTAAHPW